MEHIKQRIKESFIGKIAIALRYKYPDTAPKHSYSQTGEDLILDFFLKNKKDGFYIDIGAYHPIKLSNTYKFYKRGWRGVNIEPNHNKFHLFEKQRSEDRNLNIGIGPDNQQKKFYIFDADTLCTFSEKDAQNYQKMGHAVVETKEVSLMPLCEVMRQYAENKTIDFISIDVEGYDLEVLKTNDWDSYRPRFIVLETVEYSKEVFGNKLNPLYDVYMEGIHYKKVADTYVNTIYVDEYYIGKI